MVEFGVPYAMDGTVIPGVDLRWDTQRKVGVGSGVTDVGDLKVTPLSTPGAGFRVAAGGVLVQCRAAGRTRETYSLSNHTTQNYMGDGGAGLPGTGSGVTRSDLVILEILDSSFSKTYTPKAEWPVGQYAKISVVPGVPGATNSVDSVPALANVTAYALARIDYPASTATITAAMVKDLRKMHTPKSEPFKVTYALSGDEVDAVTATSGYPAGGQTWPLQAEVAGQLLVPIPVWATHALTEVTMYGVLFPGGEAAGTVWLRIGANTGLYVSGQDTGWDSDGVANRQRTPLGVAAKIAIPEAMRGTVQQFRPRATRLKGTNATTARLDRISSIVIDGMFVQEAV